jgi:SAV_6107-like HEPN
MSVVAAPLPVGAYELLEQARRCLADAGSARRCGERYAGAHLAALRAAAAVLAVRARPGGPHRGTRNAWALLARVAPELGEWATFFASGAAKRAAADAGLRNAVTDREADDLVRDAGRFIEICESTLGLLTQA